MARRGRPRPGGGPPRKRRSNRNRYRAQVAPAEPQVPDTPMARIEEQTRTDVARLIKNQLAGHGLMEDERLLARVIEQHPEYADVVFDASKWKSRGESESPFVHLALHRIVEQRVVTRDMTVDMTKLARDLPWHDAVHKGTEIVATELFGDQLEQAAR